jgi:hypothetical protein
MKRLLVAIFILSLLDTVTTMVLVRTGIGQEANPLLLFWFSDLYNNAGIMVAGCAIKLTGTLVAIGILNKGINHMPKATLAVAWVSAVMLAAVLLWNITVFFR